MISAFDRASRIGFKSLIKNGGQSANKKGMGTFSNIFKHSSPGSCFLDFFKILDTAPIVEFISLIKSRDQCANKEVIAAFGLQLKFVFARNK